MVTAATRIISQIAAEQCQTAAVSAYCRGTSAEAQAAQSSPEQPGYAARLQALLPGVSVPRNMFGCRLLFPTCSTAA
jgi:hypothetical protein